MEATEQGSMPEGFKDPPVADSMYYIMMATCRSQAYMMQPALDMASTLVRRLSLNSWPKKSQSLDSACSSTSSETGPEVTVAVEGAEVTQASPKSSRCSSIGRGTEPPWTNTEVDKFWLVLEPHIRKLVYGDQRLPATDVNWDVIDPHSASHLDRCLLHIQELMWTGRYSLAVADLRATVKFFKDNHAAKYDLRKRDQEMRTIKEIFLKKIPSRRRLWAAYRAHSI